MTTNIPPAQADTINPLPTSAGEATLLPARTRLLHVGVPKSGTTSLQSAFHTARDELSQYGVTYLGGPDHKAAHAVTGAGLLRGSKVPTMQDWDDLVATVRAAGERRVVVSSEIFAHADDSTAHKMASDLRDAGGPLHVVVTLRPLHRVASSQWQQYVQNRISSSYFDWLDAMFRTPPYEKPTPSFWRRHDQGGLVRRWAAQVGPENVTVVVVDETDRRMLMQTFESFVGLPDGFLVPQPSDVNRSLTVGEAELVRRLNISFKEKKWTDGAYASFVRNGAVQRMKVGRKPTAEEPRLSLPEWALERIAETIAKDAETITSLGVNIVGDLSSLAQLPKHVPVDEAEIADPSVPVEVAVQATVGAIASGIKFQKQATKLKAQVAESEAELKKANTQVATLTRQVTSLTGETTTALAPFTVKDLAAEVVRRAGQRIKRTIRLT